MQLGQGSTPRGPTQRCSGTPPEWCKVLSRTSFDSLRSLRTLACRERGLPRARPRSGRVEWCERRDSNSHDLAIASPSSWCVCQFRHFREEGLTIEKGKGKMEKRMTRYSFPSSIFPFSITSAPAEPVQEPTPVQPARCAHRSTVIPFPGFPSPRGTVRPT